MALLLVVDDEPRIRTVLNRSLVQVVGGERVGTWVSLVVWEMSLCQDENWLPPIGLRAGVLCEGRHVHSPRCSLSSTQ